MIDIKLHLRTKKDLSPFFKEPIKKVLPRSIKSLLSCLERSSIISTGSASLNSRLTLKEERSEEQTMPYPVTSEKVTQKRLRGRSTAESVKSCFFGLEEGVIVSGKEKL